MLVVVDLPFASVVTVVALNRFWTSAGWAAKAAWNLSASNVSAPVVSIPNPTAYSVLYVPFDGTVVSSMS